MTSTTTPKTSPYTITTCTHSDLPTMHSIWQHSFKNDPFLLSRWPSSQVSRTDLNRWVMDVFRGYLEKKGTETWKLEEKGTGEVVGWMHWMEVSEEGGEKKGEKEGEEEGEGDKKGKFPEGSNLDICEAKTKGWDRLRERWFRKDDMFLLHFLTISPTHQNLGLGKLLLSTLQKRAHRVQKSIYLEATLAGHPLYLKMGWRDMEVLEVDMGSFGTGRNWCMVWDWRDGVVGEGVEVEARKEEDEEVRG